MAELVFFTGTMDSGKSTLALQTDFNYTHRGRRGLVFSRSDRSGVGRISTRIGLESPAVEATVDLDFHKRVAQEFHDLCWVDYVVIDEAQFLTVAQVEQLARVVDELNVDVFAFGIATDFRTRLFPGSQRLIELADRIEYLLVPALCWCGARATHNARTVNGEMVLVGEQIVIDNDTSPEPVIAYDVLCRKHHMARQTAPHLIEKF